MKLVVTMLLLTLVLYSPKYTNSRVICGISTYNFLNEIIYCDKSSICPCVGEKNRFVDSLSTSSKVGLYIEINPYFRLALNVALACIDKLSLIVI